MGKTATRESYALICGNKAYLYKDAVEYGGTGDCEDGFTMNKITIYEGSRTITKGVEGEFRNASHGILEDGGYGYFTGSSSGVVRSGGLADFDVNSTGEVKSSGEASFGSDSKGHVESGGEAWLFDDCKVTWDEGAIIHDWRK